MSAPDISAIVPSWNTREHLRACLTALRGATGLTLETIVVDNASTDGSAELVEADFPGVRVVRNARNEGFARACNSGAALAQGRHLLLLNTDAEVGPETLQGLCAFLDANPGYAAAAPRLVNADGSTQRACMAFPGLATPLFFGTPLQRWLPESRELRRYFLRDWDQEDERDVDQPPAACLLIRRAAFEAVGPLDERLWLFFNDVDLCRRLRQAGWRIRYLAELRVRHAGGASTEKFTDFVPEWHRNRLAYYRKHHGRAAGLWVKLCVLLTWFDFALRQLLLRLRGRPAEALKPLTRSLAGFLRE